MDGRLRPRGIELASSVVLTIALALAPSTGLATAPPTDGPSAADLFREGQSRADAADYVGAIGKYEEAIALLPDDEANEGTRNRLRVELIRSHRKAFEIDDDPTHLTKAKVLIGDYRASLDAGADESRDWADGQLQEIEEALEDYEARHPPAPEPEPEPDDSGPQPEGPQLEIAPGGGNASDVPPDPAAGRSLLVAGGVLAGLGVGSVIMMAAGLGKANKAVDTFETDPGKRDQARADNQLGNTLGIAGGVAAGVFLTAGAVLMAIGAKKKKGGGRTAVAPVIDGEQFGAVLRARF
jgi:hypothetical protein